MLGHDEVEAGPDGVVVAGVGPVSSSDIEVAVSSSALEVSETSGGKETEADGKDPFIAPLISPFQTNFWPGSECK